MNKNVLAVAGIAIGLALMGQSCNLSTITKPADGGVFKSEDGGTSWAQVVRIDDKNTIGKANIIALTIDPREANTVYAGSREGSLYKTTDGGKNWTRLGLQASRINRITIDPSDSMTVYTVGRIGAAGKIFKSTDGGQTWADVYTDPVTNISISAFDIDPATPKTIYAGTGTSGIVKSEDGGDTWRLLDWTEGKVLALHVDPVHHERFYVATTDQGLYKSENAGATIEKLTISSKDFPGGELISDIAVDPTTKNTVYLATNFGLIKSVDAGKTWSGVTTLVSKGALPLKSVTIDPHHSDVLFVSTINTLYRSRDGGKTWGIQELPTTRTISTLAINPLNTNFIYLGLLYQ